MESFFSRQVIKHSRSCIGYCNSGSISGADVGSYIITGPGGYVERTVTSGGSTSVSFPVGTFSSFAPANIHLATGSTSGQVQVGVVGDVLQFGITGTDLR
jgi:hypothetical protein